MKENLHKGHRQRMRERFLAQGGEGFADHEILELLLFSCIPMRDTNELAHKLIEEFGSLPMLVEAEPQDVIRRCGISEATAVFISAQNALIKCCLKQKWEKRTFFDSSQKAGEFAISLLTQMNYERFYIICLDNQHRFIKAVAVAEGTIQGAVVYPRLVVEAALRHQASSIILTHNHPGGSLKPSLNDITTTEKIVKAMNLIDINVVDHIIVADNQYFSFAEKDMIHNVNNGE